MSRSSARAVLSVKRERTGKVHKKHPSSTALFVLEAKDGEVTNIATT